MQNMTFSLTLDLNRLVTLKRLLAHFIFKMECNSNENLQSLYDSMTEECREMIEVIEKDIEVFESMNSNEG